MWEEVSGSGASEAEVLRRLDLSENAAKKVDVHFQREGEEIHFHIRDEGNGFDPGWFAACIGLVAAALALGRPTRTARSVRLAFAPERRALDSSQPAISDLSRQFARTFPASERV